MPFPPPHFPPLRRIRRVMEGHDDELVLGITHDAQAFGLEEGLRGAHVGLDLLQVEEVPELLISPDPGLRTSHHDILVSLIPAISSRRGSPPGDHLAEREPRCREH